MKNLITMAALVAANQAVPRNYEINAEGDEATVYVYDVIGGLWGGVDDETFVKDIAALDVKTIHVRINSPGGDVFGARAMMTALAQHKAKVVAHIDGFAASAATFLAMAADEIEMAQGGFFMIHNAWTIAMGNKADFLSTAELLEKIDNSIVADYVNRTGKKSDEVVSWMDAETWFSADEAKEAGFVDKVVEQSSKKNETQWDVSAYANAPEAAKRQPKNEGRFDTAHMENLERRLALLEKTSA